MEMVSFINAPLDAEPTEQDLIEAATLLTMTAVCLEAPRRLVLLPAAAVRAIVRRTVRRLHAARWDLGDGAAQLVIRLAHQRPIGIHPIGRFVFGAA